MLTTGGTTTQTRTLITNNIAPTGANVQCTGGVLYYALPAPPGHWLPNSDCVANRLPCEQDSRGDNCRATPCSTTAGNATNNWTPTNCKAPTFIQTCEWQTADCAASPPTANCLLGKKVYTVPFLPIDITFPYPCAAGYLGGNASSDQTSSECAGKCPAGFYCPTAATVQALPCPAGYYCPLGSTNPFPCPGGTSSNVISATSMSACTAVLPGFWAGLGSLQPEPCPATGFYCPGKALDEKHGGSKPILVAVGGYTTTEWVETVQKDLTLDLSCADFNLDKVKQSLAAQYNVDPLLVILTNPCAARRRARLLQSSSSGGLTLTVTIAATATAADGTQISALPIADLLSAVQSVDDAALGASLGAALGTTFTVTSTTPVQATATRTVQSVCPPGFWCTAGLTVACEVGFYNPITNANNQSACLQCPEHATTLGARATSLLQCLCDVQFFNNHTNNGVLCLPCPVGTNCTAPGNTRNALPIKPGFWRKSNATIDVRACADVAAGCPAGQSECAQSLSGCAGGTNSTTPCRPGLTGVFCLVCDNSDKNRPHFYVAASETAPAMCSPCEEAFVVPFVAATMAIIALIACIITGFRFRHRIPKGLRSEAARRWQVLGVGVKLKQVFSFYQIACKVGVVYQVALPAAVDALLSSFEVAITLGLDVTVPFECFGASSYLQRLLFWIFAPLLVVLVLFAIGIVLCRGDRKNGILWALPLVIKLMFLLYTTVNLRAFEAFRCYDFGVDGRWLMADVRVACDSPGHESIKAWAWLAIFIYPVGWTATTACILFVARKSILGLQKPTALSNALSFVYSEFEPAFFWWEVIEMARRFLLVGLMSIVLSGTIVQLVIATLFCVFYLVLQLQAKPYKNPSDVYVALASTTSLAVLFFSCVVLKVGALTDTPEVDAILPPRLRTNFSVPSALLSVVTFASVVIILAVSVLITIQQVQHDQQRRAAEARVAKARRLRYRDNDAEVIPPVVPEGQFHLFLSHTWAQGEVGPQLFPPSCLPLTPSRLFHRVSHRSHLLYLFCTSFTSLKCRRRCGPSSCAWPR